MRDAAFVADLADAVRGGVSAPAGDGRLFGRREELALRFPDGAADRALADRAAFLAQQRVDALPPTAAGTLVENK